MCKIQIGDGNKVWGHTKGY